MSLNFTQNWDGVTAPAIPAGWNADAALVTSSAQSRSSPNSLFLNDTGGSKKYCTYATSSGDDFAIGNLTVAVKEIVTAGAEEYKAGVAYRASSATISDASGVYYWAYLHYNFSGGAPRIKLASVNNGTVTDFGNVQASFDPGSTWYLINAICNGTSHQVSFQRTSDNYYLNSSGTFVSSLAYVIGPVTNATISTGNYCGVVASGTPNANRVYMDDFAAVSQAPNQVIPHPIYVPVPRRFYTEDWG